MKCLLEILSFLEIKDIFNLCRSGLFNRAYQTNFSESASILFNRVDLLSILINTRCFAYSTRLLRLQRCTIHLAEIIINNKTDKVALFLKLFRSFGVDIQNYYVYIDSLMAVIEDNQCVFLKSKLVTAAVLTKFISLKSILHNISKLELIHTMLANKIYRIYYCIGFFDLNSLTYQSFTEASKDYEQFVVELAYSEMFGPMFELSNSKLNHLINNFESRVIKI
jgi:hypothetical protein